MKRILILSFLFCSFLFADDAIPRLVLKNGTVYLNAKIQKIDDSTIIIISKSGADSVAFSALPDDLAKKLGYDPQKDIENKNRNTTNIALANSKPEVKPDKNAPDQPESKDAKNALNFRGIYPGMTYTELAQLIKTGPLCFKYPVEKNETQNGIIFLDWDSARFPNDSRYPEFKEVGRTGVPGKITRYEWDYIAVSMHNGKAYEIDVHSAKHSADGLDSDTIPWVNVAYESVSQKWNKPTETIKLPKDLSILDFDSGYLSICARWDIDDQAIVVGAGEYDSEFYGEIEFQDSKVEAEIKNGDKKVQSGL